MGRDYAIGIGNCDYGIALALSRKWWYILVPVLFHWLVRWQDYDV